MAYDEYIADRIRKTLKEKKMPFRELKMMGGLCFMVDNKMCLGTHLNKETGDDLLMIRIGEEVYEKEITKPECLPMDFTGRPMKGYLFVKPDGYDLDDDLNYWIQLCLNYNPLAKSSKKK